MESPLPSPGGEEPEFRTRGVTPHAGPASASASPPTARLWRPAAQRNLRNQWSRMLANRRRWESVASEGRSSATALVNAYLSRRYMPEMNLGVLKDMPEIRQMACNKLVCRQEQCQRKLLSSYKELVDVVSQFVQACSFMRCFIKGSGAGPLVQFTHHSEDKNDPGDGGGIAVFSFWPLSYFEKLARELVEMFALEISFKRLIVLQLLSISCLEAPRAQTDRISWSSELYQGEFDGLNMIDLLCKEKCQPIPPRIKDFRSDNPLTEQVNHDPDREVLQVYLTAWILEVNVDTKRYSTPSCESFDVEPEPVKILARSLAPSLALAISKLMDKLVVMMMNLAASNKFSSWKRYGLLLVLYQVSILLVCNHSSACIRLPLGNLRRCF